MPFEYKTKYERVEEVVKTLKKLDEMSFPSENNGIIELKKILKSWAYNGEYKKGKINLEGFDRIIIYELFPRKNVEILINLKYVKNI